MDSQKIASEIERRLKVLNVKPKTFCREAKLNETWLRDLKKGKTRSPTTESLGKAAAYFGISVEELVGSSLATGKRPQTFMAPVVDWIHAGKYTEATNPYPKGIGHRRIPVEYHRGSIIALEIKGSSINRKAPEGAFIVVDYDDRQLVDGKFYVIRAEGDTTVKRYRSKPQPRFEPYSTEPDHPTIFEGQGLVEIVGRVVRAQMEM